MKSKEFKPTCPFCMKQDKVRIIKRVAVVCDRCDAAF